MILSDKEISALVQSDSLIENYEPGQLQSASYDIVSNGIIQAFNRVQCTIDLRRPGSVELAHKEIPIDDGYRMLPGEYILVKTHECFHMPRKIVGHVRPRTTISRFGLILSGQHLNPTWRGHLYLGLFNATPNAVEIFRGLRIGQIVFERLEGEVSEALLYENKKDAKYQDENRFIKPNISSELLHAYRNELNRRAGETPK